MTFPNIQLNWNKRKGMQGGILKIVKFVASWNCGSSVFPLQWPMGLLFCCCFKPLRTIRLFYDVTCNFDQIIVKFDNSFFFLSFVEKQNVYCLLF